MCPTRHWAKRTSRVVIPPVFIKLPARMKKGMARREKLVVPAYIRCGTIMSRLGVPNARKLRTAVRPMLTAMGIPRNISRTRSPKIAAVTISFPLLPAAALFLAGRFDVLQELLNVFLTGVLADLLVSWLHGRAEQSQVRSGHLRARLLHLGNQIPLLRHDLLAHGGPRLPALFLEDSLLLRCELGPRLGADRVNHVVVDVAGERQVLLDLVELHEVDH